MANSKNVDGVKRARSSKKYISTVPMMINIEDYPLFYENIKEEKYIKIFEKYRDYKSSNDCLVDGNDIVVNYEKMKDILYENPDDYYCILNNNIPFCKENTWFLPVVYFFDKKFLSPPIYTGTKYEKLKEYNKPDLQGSAMGFLYKGRQLKISTATALAAGCLSLLNTTITNNFNLYYNFIYIYINRDPITKEIYSLEISTSSQKKYEDLYVMKPGKISNALLKTLGITYEEYETKYNFQKERKYKEEIKNLVKKKIIISNEENVRNLELIGDEFLEFSVTDLYKATTYLYLEDLDSKEVFKFLKSTCVDKPLYKSNAECIAEILKSITVANITGKQIASTKLLPLELTASNYTLFTNAEATIKSKSGLYYLFQYYDIKELLFVIFAPMEFIENSSAYSLTDVYIYIKTNNVIWPMSNGEKNSDELEGDEMSSMQLYFPQCNTRFFYCLMLDIESDFAEKYEISNDYYAEIMTLAELEKVMDFIIKQPNGNWWLNKDDDYRNLYLNSFTPIVFMLLLKYLFEIIFLHAKIHNKVNVALFSKDAKKLYDDEEVYFEAIDKKLQITEPPEELFVKYRNLFEDALEKTMDKTQEKVNAFCYPKTTVEYYSKCGLFLPRNNRRERIVEKYEETVRKYKPKLRKRGSFRLQKLTEENTENIEKSETKKYEPEVDK